MRKRKSNIKRLLYLVVLISIIMLGLIWYLRGISPVNRNTAEYKNFKIQQGLSLRQIADELHTEGLIKDPYTFLLVVKFLGIDNSVQAGEFELSANMDTFTIAKKLTRSTTDVRITIPEGKRSEEVAEILINQIPELPSDTLNSKLITHEGYLFPDTYNFDTNAGIDEIINTMTDNFEKKYQGINHSDSLSKQDLVIIASMIEREARHEEDRALVSSVIHNRLDIGMKLDIDATIQYALGYNNTQRSWWKKGLTAKDLAIDSPYNTYTTNGLPPAPISNPGLASLKAAADPVDTDYLYYFTDKNGINHYARTLNEQSENIKIFGL